MVVRVFAPDHYSPLDESGQFAADCRARTDVQQKKLFQGQCLPLLFRVADLDDDIEIDDGSEEGQLLPFKLPNLFQSGE